MLCTSTPIKSKIVVGDSFFKVSVTKVSCSMALKNPYSKTRRNGADINKVVRAAEMPPLLILLNI